MTDVLYDDSNLDEENDDVTLVTETVDFFGYVVRTGDEVAVDTKDFSILLRGRVAGIYYNKRADRVEIHVVVDHPTKRLAREEVVSPVQIVKKIADLNSYYQSVK